MKSPYNEMFDEHGAPRPRYETFHTWLKEVALSIPEPSWNCSKKSISIVSTSKKLGPVPIQTPKTKTKRTKASKSIKAKE